MSDSRAAALVVHTTGEDVLDRLPGRWVWMGSEQTRLFGPWEDWQGMRVSNTHFVHRLRNAQARRKVGKQAADTRPRTQGCLFACTSNGAANGATICLS